MGIINHIKNMLNVSQIIEEKEKLLENYNQTITENNTLKAQNNELLKINNYTADEKKRILEEIESNENEIRALLLKNQNIKFAFDSIKKSIKSYRKENDPEALNDATNVLLTTNVDISLNCLNVKELRSLYNKNKKNIEAVLKEYEKRYTTKANISIYKLMVVGLEASTQNILTTLKYNNLEKSLESLKQTLNQYYTIASSGNQNIAPTMNKFISEIGVLYEKSIEIEYEYYVKKERIKEEQRALKEQMKQEAEERKLLEAEQKKIEKEEFKFKNEIENIENEIKNTSDKAKIALLRAQLANLNNKLNEISEKKEEIIRLQNGKAGHVYVISNLGSFGDDVFKVGMTRRLEPMDRVNELGNASVPFSFDVHSLIFSEDAVGLEHKLHIELNKYRVNRVNLRKEFFRISIDELESLVQEICPSAEFNKTMLAEQYRHGLSVEEIPETLADFKDDESEETDE